MSDSESALNSLCFTCSDAFEKIVFGLYDRMVRLFRTTRLDYTTYLSLQDYKLENMTSVLFGNGFDRHSWLPH